MILKRYMVPYAIYERTLGVKPLARGTFENLKGKKQSLVSDAAPLPFSTVCLIEGCQFIRTLGDNKPYTWTYFTTRQKTVAYMVIHYLDEVSCKENDSVSSIEWGPEAADLMSFHKLGPTGGSGVNCSIHDANRLNALSVKLTRAEIEKAFQAYRDERILWVEAANNSSLIFKSMVE
ncbi:hypothetical protein BGZ96_012588 [Linnemannia gamsii]|uniref:Uncharacterized protein n=1 Tax=Linnemannia gamsii TaxID=64522 RepID=A0ABQ7JQE0_9FUNG|nr:hypothetical protein BGZ96_012588 [Linnemannia gamsii]